jgi:hypothetical protein
MRRLTTTSQVQTRSNRLMSDLSDLDGNALVARLAVLKVRVLEDSSAAQPALSSNEGGNAQMAEQRSDTEAVLDECASRLLAQDHRGLVELSLRSAEEAQARTDAALAEADRLRLIIGRAVAYGFIDSNGGPDRWCRFCHFAPPSHVEGCPVPHFLAAERS